MAKDAKGHGSEKRGARYQAIVQPYSLAANQVGKLVGRETVLSSHKSLAAAGNTLGSHIGGKNAQVPQRLAGIGNSYRIFVRDTHTGSEHSRNDARDIAAQHGIPTQHLSSEYNRDLALRVRDRQVGSGMKHR